MGGILARDHTLRPLVRGVDRQSVASARRARNIRPLHLASLLPLRLEQECPSVREELRIPHRLRVGQRYNLRYGRSLAHTPVRIPDVCHPILVDGEDAAHRRLSLRQQGDIRTPDAQHPRIVPLRTPYHALLADQEVIQRVHQMAVPPTEGSATDRTQRRGGI